MLLYRVAHVFFLLYFFVIYFLKLKTNELETLTLMSWRIRTDLCLTGRAKQKNHNLRQFSIFFYPNDHRSDRDQSFKSKTVHIGISFPIMFLVIRRLTKVWTSVNIDRGLRRRRAYDIENYGCNDDLFSFSFGR